MRGPDPFASRHRHRRSRAFPVLWRGPVSRGARRHRRRRALSRPRRRHCLRNGYRRARRGGETGRRLRHFRRQQRTRRLRRRARRTDRRHGKRGAGRKRHPARQPCSARPFRGPVHRRAGRAAAACLAWRTVGGRAGMGRGFPIRSDCLGGGAGTDAASPPGSVFRTFSFSQNAIAPGPCAFWPVSN